MPGSSAGVIDKPLPIDGWIDGRESMSCQNEPVPVTVPSDAQFTHTIYRDSLWN